MKPWFIKSDSTYLCFIPFVHASGCKRKYAFAGRFIINRKINGIGIVCIKCNNFISTGYFDIHCVIDPFIILGPADIELVYRRSKIILVVIEICKVLGIRNIYSFVFAEIPLIGRCMRPLVIRDLIEFTSASV